MDVLVTGGAGFIGSHLVDLLAEGGHRVRVLDRLHPGPRRPTRQPARRRRVPLGRPGRARPGRCRRRRPGGLPPGGHGRVGHRPRRHRGLRARQRPGHGPAAGRAAPPPRPGRPVGAGQLDGRLRRGWLPLPGARTGAACAPGTGAAGRRPLGAAVPGMWAGAGAAAGDRGGRDRPTQHLRRHQAPPGGPGVRGHGRRRAGGHRPAPPQRLRPPDAPRHPLCRGGGHLPQRPRGRAGAAGAGGRPPATRLRPCPRRRPGQPARAGGDRPGARGVQRGQRPTHTVGEMATALAAATDGPAPQIVGGWRPGDVRHIFASPAQATTRLGFHAEVGSPRAWPSSRPRRCGHPPAGPADAHRHQRRAATSGCRTAAAP
jgi:NAD dependent epimerase/dehydratase family